MNAMLGQYRAAVIAVAAVVLLTIGIGIGWSLNGWRLSAQVSAAQAQVEQERTAHQADLAAISNAAAQQVTQALAKQQEAQQAVAELDRKHTEEMQNAKDENDRLRGDVADGRRRLQLKASCPADSRGMPSTAGASGLADGAGPRLDDSAERDYWRLRDDITSVRSQIAGLQQYIRTVCLAPR